MVKRSEISNTSLSLWLTKSMAMPWALSLSMISNSAATSFLVSAVVGSSMMMSLASNISARQMATICFSATLSEPTRRSSSTSKLILERASVAIWRMRFLLTNLCPAASSVLKARFSMTVRFGKMAKS